MEKHSDADIEALHRFIRVLGMVILIGIGSLALHVLDCKVDQEGFWEGSTGWMIGQSNVFLALLGALGFTAAFFASFVLMGVSGVLVGSPWYVRAPYALSFLATLGMILTLSNSPNWFAKVTLAVSVVGTLAIYCRHRRLAAQPRNA
jgi:hypothetical protein